jgi:leader peptidase (prepilin peptidase)/N-methyltransferase
MNAALAAVVFAPALAVGSFLNVVASRLPLGQSISHPRSKCPHCETQIAARDNIPLVSFFALRGRCRSCREPISWRYPAVELLTAVLVAACVVAFGLSLHALAAALFCVALVAISATDLERMIVPNRIVLPAALAVLVLQLVRAPGLEWPVAGLGAALFLFLAALAYPKGMGMGDVKLALLLGVAVGWAVPVALMGGMILALIPSIFLLVKYGSEARKRAIPFAPFLALGGVIALFAGHVVIDWYTGFLS